MSRPSFDAARDATLFDARLLAPTAEVLDELGFGHWDEDSPLRLIPAGQWHRVPNGVVVQSISGDNKMVGRDHISTGTRCGYLAWGLVPGDQLVAPSAHDVAIGDVARRETVIQTLADHTVIAPGHDTSTREKRVALLRGEG